MEVEDWLVTIQPAPAKLNIMDSTVGDSIALQFV